MRDAGNNRINGNESGEAVTALLCSSEIPRQFADPLMLWRLHSKLCSYSNVLVAHKMYYRGNDVLNTDNRYTNLFQKRRSV
jgi:hypothetical protein